jgi:hypothetical protein
MTPETGFGVPRAGHPSETRANAEKAAAPWPLFRARPSRSRVLDGEGERQKIARRIAINVVYCVHQNK